MLLGSRSASGRNVYARRRVRLIATQRGMNIYLVLLMCMALWAAPFVNAAAQRATPAAGSTQTITILHTTTSTGIYYRGAAGRVSSRVKTWADSIALRRRCVLCVPKWGQSECSCSMPAIR